jgi:hypothetical protein
VGTMRVEKGVDFTWYHMVQTSMHSNKFTGRGLVSARLDEVLNTMRVIKMRRHPEHAHGTILSALTLQGLSAQVEERLVWSLTCL